LPHYESAKKLLRKRNSGHYREPQQRFAIKQSVERYALFTTSSNLRVLCACDVLLMGVIFKSCPRYFIQLYTVFG